MRANVGLTILQEQELFFSRFNSKRSGWEKIDPGLSYGCLRLSDCNKSEIVNRKGEVQFQLFIQNESLQNTFHSFSLL